jgi:diguanylate cyclase (GGDEF)-like protein
VTRCDATLDVDFTARELLLAVRLAAQIAALRAQRNQLAQAHSAVRELAETDPLTGLPNRRAWTRRVPALLAEAGRDGQPAWMALVDLDSFKSINDQRGMSDGDRVLASCGRALAAATRRKDLVARLGGDEFGVLLVGVDEERVPEVFERLRSSVAAAGEVTASIGFTQVCEGAAESDILEAAEVALRTAKRAGGNQARQHSHEMK